MDMYIFKRVTLFAICVTLQDNLCHFTLPFDAYCMPICHKLEPDMAHVRTSYSLLCIFSQ
ncbi:hypothetical protein HMPREF0971_00407 [Segatella oris F0302]|uniref:Uncharacterized protein n=1 Tax=Segatella oris F0302 TaxID=649760 RepID=D1QN71_9BACT|nr:hypothetical protein HMPREF0971_00407 [Segatella oris F0302]